MVGGAAVIPLFGGESPLGRVAMKVIQYHLARQDRRALWFGGDNGIGIRYMSLSFPSPEDGGAKLEVVVQLKEEDVPRLIKELEALK